ncbi:MAG TPA: enterotoxin, partial [Candidatus Binatia bacterium]|nr:enterotoxin [Candidatus Binatia bacterium]
GTQLQEMYITPTLLSARDWDVLAEAAKWSRANAATLKDSHWIGGDPAKLEVYGWAAWSPERAIVTLRNPSDRPQDFAADIAALLELPARAAASFTATSPWKAEAGNSSVRISTQPHTFRLQPFQVLTLELIPGRSIDR